jgi:hypothetical protein
VTADIAVSCGTAALIHCLIASESKKRNKKTEDQEDWVQNSQQPHDVTLEDKEASHHSLKIIPEHDYNIRPAMPFLSESQTGHQPW